MYIPVKHRKISARSDFLGKHPKNTTTTVFSEASTPLPRCFMTCPHLAKHLIMVYLTFWLKAHTFTLGKPDPSTPKVWRSTPCVVWFVELLILLIEVLVVLVDALHQLGELGERVLQSLLGARQPTGELLDDLVLRIRHQCPPTTDVIE